MAAGSARAAMMEPCGLLHVAAAVGTTVDFHLEHAMQALGPRNAVLATSVAGVPVGVLVLVGRPARSPVATVPCTEAAAICASSGCCSS